MRRSFGALALVTTLTPAALWAGDMPGRHFIENWDLNGDGAVTLEELVERRGDVFAAFDANDDGRLDAEDYATFDEARANDMADNAGAGGKGEGRVQKGMTLAFNDIDGDGVVTREEFLSRAAAWMAMIDRNGDGRITPADFGRK